MKTKTSRHGLWTLALIILAAGVLPIPYPGAGGGDPLSTRGMMVSAWDTLAASAEASDDYLVQTQRAMDRIHIHMTRLSHQVSEEDPLTRCSFLVAMRKYNDTREVLLREIRQARAARQGEPRTRRKIEARLDELRQAYTQALSCYQ